MENLALPQKKRQQQVGQTSSRFEGVFLKDDVLNAGVLDDAPRDQRAPPSSGRTHRTSRFLYPFNLKIQIKITCCQAETWLKPLISLLCSCLVQKEHLCFINRNAVVICNKVLKKPQQGRRHLRVLKIRAPPDSLSPAIDSNTFAFRRGFDVHQSEPKAPPMQPRVRYRHSWRGNSRWRKSLVHRIKEIKKWKTFLDTEAAHLSHRPEQKKTHTHSE